MANDEPIHLKTELWRSGLQTDSKIENNQNYIMFLALKELHDILSEVNVTNSTNAKDLLESLRAKTNEKMQAAMQHWEMNDPDN